MQRGVQGSGIIFRLVRVSGEMGNCRGGGKSRFRGFSGGCPESREDPGSGGSWVRVVLRQRGPRVEGTVSGGVP